MSWAQVSRKKNYFFLIGNPCATRKYIINMMDKNNCILYCPIIYLLLCSANYIVLIWMRSYNCFYNCTLTLAFVPILLQLLCQAYDSQNCIISLALPELYYMLTSTCASQNHSLRLYITIFTSHKFFSEIFYD